MPVKTNERIYRMMQPFTVPSEEDANKKRFNSAYYVEGYATTLISLIFFSAGMVLIITNRSTGKPLKAPICLM